MPWIGPLISVGGSLLSGSMGSGASNNASQAQVNSTGQAIDEQRRQYDQTRADQAPFIAGGTAATKRLQQLLGLSGAPSGTMYTRPGTGEQYKWNGANWVDMAGNPISEWDAADAQGSVGDQSPLLRKFGTADLNADPVYNSGLQFGLDQGTAGINARAIAGGGYDSGATLKALTRFGNDYGSTKANESYNRYTADQTGIYNKLAGVVGSGQQATNQVQAAGTSMANNVSGNLTDAGNARAAGIVGGANAWGSAASGISNAANNYQSNQTLQALLKQRTGYSGTPYGTGYSNYDYTAI